MARTRTDQADRSGRRRSLDASLVHSLTWTGAVKWVSQVLSWLATLVVARLLVPEDYGLVAMATVYLGLVTLLSEFGLGITVVTMRELRSLEIKQLNTLAILMGAASVGLSFLAAAPLAAFFDEPRLTSVVLIMSLGFIITSFRIVPGALLQRELRFKTLALIEGAQAITLAVTMITLAWLGWGYWTLVAGSLLAALLSTAITASIQRVGFALPRITEMKESLTFTRHQLTGNLSWYVYSNADFLVAGRVLGPSQLGVYSLAWTLAQAVPEKITGLITRVTPAYFSAVQDDNEELRRYLLRLTETLSLISLPALIGLALVARPLVDAVLGPQWAGMVIPMQVLAIYAAYNSVTQLLSRVLTARRETAFLMRVGIALAIVMPVAFWVGSRWGPTGIALGWLTFHPLARIPVLLRVRRTTGLRIRHYARSLWPATSSSVVMAGAVIAVGAACSTLSPAVRLAAMVIGGLFTYSVVVLTFHRSRVLPLLALFRRGLTGDKIPAHGGPAT